MKTAVEAKGLVKKFGDRVAVAGIDIEIHKGECFGLLGPNGAGKSTTMRMMYGSCLLTAGELYILGLNAKKSYREIKARIGVVPQEDGLDTEFTVRENLLLYARYHGIDEQVAIRRVDHLLRLMRLEEEGATDVRHLSGGMRRRLAIARGMVNQPELLFFDEPTAGLDPQARVWIWEFLRKIKADMGTVVLTTHDMQEAETLCDRIAIMEKGKILSMGTPQELIRAHIGKEVVEFEVAPSDNNYYLARLKEKGYLYQAFGRTISVYIQQEQEGKSVFGFISSSRLTLRKPNLNDVFLKLAGYELHQDFL